MKLKFIPNHKTKSTVIAKARFQIILKNLRNAGFIVTKILGGYMVTTETPLEGISEGKEIQVMRAMNGSRGYLVRMIDGLLT